METDVRITKDKHIIVCHDDDFERVCGIKQYVKETLLQDIPKFKNKIPMHFSKD